MFLIVGCEFLDKHQNSLCHRQKDNNISNEYLELKMACQIIFLLKYLSISQKMSNFAPRKKIYIFFSYAGYKKHRRDSAR